MTCSARACVAPDQRDLSRVAVHRFGELRLRVSVPSAQRLHSLADNSSATARASGWGPSTVDGILRNLKYCGIWTWNRTGKRLDPRTGRRHSYAKPPEDHVVRTYPELRIISQSLWDDVQARRQAVAKVWPGGQRRGFTSAQGSRSDVYPSHLFDGMLRCACCKQAIGIVGGKAGGYYGCLAARRSACENRLTLCPRSSNASFLAPFGTGSSTRLLSATRFSASPPRSPRSTGMLPTFGLASRPSFARPAENSTTWSLSFVPARCLTAPFSPRRLRSRSLAFRGFRLNSPPCPLTAVRRCRSLQRSGLPSALPSFRPCWSGGRRRRPPCFAVCSGGSISSPTIPSAGAITTSRTRRSTSSPSSIRPGPAGARTVVPDLSVGGRDRKGFAPLPWF